MLLSLNYVVSKEEQDVFRACNYWKNNVVLVLGVITVSVQSDCRWFLTKIFNFLILGSFSLVLGSVHNEN